MFERAKIYTPRELPRPVSYFREPWQCFKNSYQFAKDTGVQYVEGIAVAPFGAMPHAWCSIDGTDVLDLTWPYQHVNKYFGIQLDPAWMEKNDVPWGFLGYLYNYNHPMATPRATKAHIEKWSRSFETHKEMKGA